jgi:hypothetical protein
MTSDEYETLVSDIKEHGLREPIWLFEGQVLDGRHRYVACLDLHIEPRTRTYRGNNPLGFVLSQNLHRRHLSESQRGMIAAKMATLPPHRPNKGANLHPSITEAAALLNVSKRTVKSARVVTQKGVRELVHAVESGKVAVSTAAKIAKLPAPEQLSFALSDADAPRRLRRPEVPEESLDEKHTFHAAPDAFVPTMLGQSCEWSLGNTVDELIHCALEQEGSAEVASIVRQLLSTYGEEVRRELEERMRDQILRFIAQRIRKLAGGSDSDKRQQMLPGIETALQRSLGARILVVQADGTLACRNLANPNTTFGDVRSYRSSLMEQRSILTTKAKAYLALLKRCSDAPDDTPLVEALRDSTPSSNDGGAS